MFLILSTRVVAAPSARELWENVLAAEESDPASDVAAADASDPASEAASSSFGSICCEEFAAKLSGLGPKKRLPVPVSGG